MLILPWYFTRVKEQVAHELQHNAAMKAGVRVVVVVMTAPRNKLDSSVDCDSFSAQADRTLVDD